MDIDEKIIALAKNAKGSIYEIAKSIQISLLYDTGNHIGINYIIETIAKG